MNDRSRRDFLKLMGVGALAATCPGLPGCGGGGRPRPNIVVVLADDHRHDMMGCAGHPWLRTPELDRLAHDGVRFTDAFVTTSLCSPSRASFLTGAYAHEHGVTINAMNDPDPSLPTYPELLQAAGYQTAFIGKWHMARWSTPRRGFDHWVSFNGQGDYQRNTLNVNGAWELSERYLTDELTDRALSFVQQKRAQPFLLVLSHKAVHAPCIPASRHASLYDDVDVPPAGLDDSRLERQRARYIREYARTLAAVDEGLGRLRECLDDRGLARDTAVIYAGDNGYFLGEHGGLWDKRAAYEESIRVPVLMSYPGVVRSGGTNDAMILNLDLAPTLLALAGIAPPPSMQGTSWMPQLDGAPGREEFLYEYFEEQGEVPTTFAVRTRDWKLIVVPDASSAAIEMYDLRHDPGETTNLVDDPAHAATRTRLFAALARLAEETGLRDSGLPCPEPPS